MASVTTIALNLRTNTLLRGGSTCGVVPHPARTKSNGRSRVCRSLVPSDSDAVKTRVRAARAISQSMDIDAVRAALNSLTYASRVWIGVQTIRIHSQALHRAIERSRHDLWLTRQLERRTGRLRWGCCQHLSSHGLRCLKTRRCHPSRWR